MGVVTASASFVAILNSALRRTRAKWPVWPPHWVVGMVDTIFAACLRSCCTLTLVGLPTILSIGAFMMMALTASRMAASFATEFEVAMIWL